MGEKKVRTMTFNKWYEANKEVLTTTAMLESLRRAWNAGFIEGLEATLDDSAQPTII